MLTTKEILGIFNTAYPEGKAVLVDDTSFDFSFDVGAAKLVGWAFALGGAEIQGIVTQVYCTESTDPKHLNEARILINELNVSMPFGCYQMEVDGAILYRNQGFFETTEHAKYAIRRALEWTDEFMQRHLVAIASVSQGFATAESALNLIKSKIEDGGEVDE